LLGVVRSVYAAVPAPIEPVRVCEILRDPNAWRGKAVAIVGRYSFRTTGRFLSEEACDSKKTKGEFVWPSAVQLVVDGDVGPKLPESFEVDQAAASRQLHHVLKTTALGKFRFGSVEYDRYAIVYGRVETAREFDSPPASIKPSKSGLEPAPVHLVIRGDGLIFFIAPE